VKNSSAGRKTVNNQSINPYRILYPDELEIKDTRSGYFTTLVCGLFNARQPTYKELMLWVIMNLVESNDFADSTVVLTLFAISNYH
jgi:hypothetical protein